MALVQVRAPTADPIDLADVKLYCRVDSDDSDPTLIALIAAARDYAETQTRKQLIVARWKQVMDRFPGGIYSIQAIQLGRHPVLKVESIQYLDMQGQVQTVDPTTYVIDYVSEPVRITPVFGAIWPIPMPQIGSVWVTYTAGYAAPITFSGSNMTVDSCWPALAAGDAIRLSNTGGNLPAPLAPKTDYFIGTAVSPGVYTLTTADGTPVAITGQAVGSCFLGAVPDGIMQWMKLRLASIYANPEEATAITTGAMVSLPYVDRLLDGFRVY